VPDHSTLMWTAGFRQSPLLSCTAPLLLTTDDGPFRVRTAEKIGAACASSTGSDAGSLCHAWW
jgi:hypothetical protein